jgi:predicted AAA+ superfamily ATPase
MMASMFPRRIRPLIVEGLGDSRIVFIAGARQVGKTTLTSSIIEEECPMRAFTLDDQVTREAALADPAGFLASIEKPVFIDEIHRAPDLLLALKRAVDPPNGDTRPGRFLITGSANILASKKVQDALTGRLDRIRMWPLSQSEIQGGKLNIVDELFAGRAPQVTGAVTGHAAFSSIVAAGGYPEARLRDPGRSRVRWFSNYVETTIDRDLREIADAQRIEDMGRLLRLLGTQSANLVNYSKIARQLDMDDKTVKHYASLLQQMFLIQRLPAWRPGLGAREVSTQKVYITDTGLLAYLLGADEARIANDDQITGKICETFVTTEVLKHVSAAEDVVTVYHYQRVHEDVDLVVENRRGEIVTIEVKAGATVHEKNWRPMAKLRDARGSKFKAGIIVYAGEQTVPLGDRLWAVPFAGLWA